MNLKAVIDLIQSGKQPVCRFKQEIDDCESVLEKGMLGRLVGFREDRDGEGLYLSFNIKEFESHNIPLMTPNYYDDDNIPRLKAIETNFYPKNGIEEIWWSYLLDVPFEIVEENSLLNRYIESGSNESYAEWLEKLVFKHEEAWNDLKNSLKQDIQSLEDLKSGKPNEELIRLNGKKEGITHCMERIRTTQLHHQINIQ